MTDDLSAAVKRKLNITWSDSDTDARIADIIKAVAPAVARVVALPESSPKIVDDHETRGLVIGACFYEWNNALDEFWANYSDDIQRCRIKHELEAFDAPKT